MKKEYLGDAYDHWKGSLISILIKKKAIHHNLAVMPMLTERWTANDLRVYGKLLNLSPSRIHLNNIPIKCDLFIDPDIGIEPPSGPNKKHIKLDKIKVLLEHNNRVLMVYQHTPRKIFREQICETLKRISRKIPKVHYCVYECGQVAMIFISSRDERIEKIKKSLKSYLGRTDASGRIWPK
jgi:hypothetical protein